MIFIINLEKAEFLDSSCKAGQGYLMGPFNSFTFDSIYSLPGQRGHAQLCYQSDKHYSVEHPSRSSSFGSCEL